MVSATSCDADNRITYICPQIEAVDGPARAAAGPTSPTHWHEMLHPDDRERVVTADFGDGTLDIEYRMRGRDGAWIWVWEREVKVPGQAGSQGICLDITRAARGARGRSRRPRRSSAPSSTPRR